MLLLDHGPARSIGAGVHAATERDNCANRVRSCPPSGTGWTLSDFKWSPGVRRTPKADTLGPLRSALVTSALVTRAAKPATTGCPRCRLWVTPGLSVRVRRIENRNLAGATPDYVAQAPKGRRGVPRSSDRRSIIKATPLHGAININQAVRGLPFFTKEVYENHSSTQALAATLVKQARCVPTGSPGTVCDQTGPESGLVSHRP